MSKIKRLTSDQEALFPVYRDKWIKIGLSTDPVDANDARRIFADFYTQILQRPEPIVIVMPSPLTAWLAVRVLTSRRDQVENRVSDQVWAQVWAQVRSQVWSQVWDQVWSQVWSQVWDQVGAQVEAQVEAQVWDQVGDQVRDQVWNQAQKQVEDFVWPCQDGQFFAHIFSFYDFMLSVLHVKLSKDLVQRYAVWEKTVQFGPIWALDKFCVVSDRPAEIHHTINGLHCDDGPAILYQDGFAVWALNGVHVPQEIAETPANQLDCTLLAKTENVEIRREIVRKIGLERLFHELNANILHEETYTSLDPCTMQMCEHHYRLLTLNLGRDVTGYGLEMVNPSTGDTHIEFVPPTCQTVGDALEFRNGAREFPTILT